MKKLLLLLGSTTLFSPTVLHSNSGQLVSPKMNKLITQMNAINKQILDEKYAVSDGYKKLITTTQSYDHYLKPTTQSLDDLYYTQCKATLKTQIEINKLRLAFYQKAKELRTKLYQLEGTMTHGNADKKIKELKEQIIRLTQSFSERIDALQETVEQSTPPELNAQLEEAKEHVAATRLSHESYELYEGMHRLFKKYADPTKLLTKAQKEQLIKLEDQLIKTYSEALKLDPCFDYRSDRPSLIGTLENI